MLTIYSICSCLGLLLLQPLNQAVVLPVKKILWVILDVLDYLDLLESAGNL